MAATMLEVVRHALTQPRKPGGSRSNVPFTPAEFEDRHTVRLDGSLVIHTFGTSSTMRCVELLAQCLVPGFRIEALAQRVTVQSLGSLQFDTEHRST